MMSMILAGEPSLSFMTGMRLTPPARTLASGPNFLRRDVASLIDFGAKYSNFLGIIRGEFVRRKFVDKYYVEVGLRNGQGAEGLRASLRSLCGGCFPRFWLTISVMMLSAISSGVTAPMSKPTGA